MKMRSLQVSNRAGTQTKESLTALTCPVPSLKNVLSSNPLSEPTSVATFLPSSKKEEDAENQWAPAQGPPWEVPRQGSRRSFS